MEHEETTNPRLNVRQQYLVLLIVSVSMMVGVAVFGGVAIVLARSGALEPLTPGPQPKPYGTERLGPFPVALPSRLHRDGGGRSIADRRNSPR